jgi:DNA-directed RNA polymerase specialized sigma24 family protein
VSPITPSAAILSMIPNPEDKAIAREHLRTLRTPAPKAPKAPKVRESAELASGVRRMLRAVSTRAAGDIEALPLLAEIARAADDALVSAIVAAQAGGYSYAEIAARLGTTRQAVHQRATAYQARQAAAAAVAG